MHDEPQRKFPVGTHCPPEQVCVQDGQALPHEPQLLFVVSRVPQAAPPAPQVP
jgi:hypothetical protein